MYWVFIIDVLLPIIIEEAKEKADAEKEMETENKTYRKNERVKIHMHIGIMLYLIQHCNATFYCLFIFVSLCLSCSC